ncbi:MAG: hypothetical protein PHT07_16590 [Paludibacter sp.]|nr:hypothetical protein [Paludibacter sp.]
MNVFINDCLLQNDLLERHLVDVNLFLSSIRDLSTFCDVIVSKRLEYNDQIPLKLYISESILSSLFELISDKDIENYLTAKISKAMPIYWEPVSIQDHQKQYFFIDTSVSPPINLLINSTSLAEAYEYSLKYKNATLALNFPDSILSKHNALLIFTVKNTPIGTKTISCVDSVSLFEEWIDQNIDNIVFSYDKSSYNPPSDNQTCLRSKIRFVETSRSFHGRKIFVEKRTGYNWYVDSLHHGGKSHIEVFDENNKFVGEANLEGVLVKKTVNPHNNSNSDKKKLTRILRVK